MKLTTLLLLLFTTFLTESLFSQQDAQFTQYTYNTVILNPAYAGSRDALSFNGTYRSQWRGLEGAPNTQSFSVNDLIIDKVGVGISLVRDAIGPSVETNITGDFSYHLNLGQNKTKLAFGIKAGMHSLDIDFNKLNVEDLSEVNSQGQVSKISPQIGTGIYVYAPQWFFGISTPNLLQTDHYDELAYSTATERLHLFAMGGYVFDFNENVKLKPSFLTKMVSGSPLSVDVSANFLIHETLDLGISYRSSASISTLLGIQISPKLLIGYSYDFDTTELGAYNVGSHELFLRFEIVDILRNTVSPRFF